MLRAAREQFIFSTKNQSLPLCDPNNSHHDPKRSAIPWVKETVSYFCKAIFTAAWVVKIKNINANVLSLGEPGSVLSLAKYNFTLRYFVSSKTENMF